MASTADCRSCCSNVTVANIAAAIVFDDNDKLGIKCDNDCDASNCNRFDSDINDCVNRGDPINHDDDEHNDSDCTASVASD